MLAKRIASGFIDLEAGLGVTVVRPVIGKTDSGRLAPEVWIATLTLSSRILEITGNV